MSRTRWNDKRGDRRDGDERDHTEGEAECSFADADDEEDDEGDA